MMQTAQTLERCYTNSTPYAYNSATCTAAVPMPFVVAAGTYQVNVCAPQPLRAHRSRRARRSRTRSAGTSA